jgi:hypothetical protein
MFAARSDTSSSFLTGINSKLSIGSDIKEGRQLELAVCDIAFELLKIATAKYAYSFLAYIKK